jgi:sugar-specific transcriptional regulator TrmB
MGYFLNSIDQNAQALSSFGLTVKQAKIYLALVSLGTSAVGDISKLSKVRREEVYRILPKLEKMGLIEKTLSTPVKLKGAPIENALSILIRNEEENAKNRIIDLTKRKEEFLQNYRTGTKSASMGDGDQFSLSSEKAVSLSKAQSLIDAAQTQLDYIASREKVLQFFKFFSDSLKQAANRGIRFRVISNSPKGEDELPLIINQLFGNKNNVSIRYLEQLPNHFLIMDNQEVLIATSTSGYLCDKPILWSNNVPHVTVYKKLFDEMWASSVESVALNVNSDIERLRRFITQMNAPQHKILMYETMEAKFVVLTNYVKIGLESGEAVVYVCSESSVEEVTTAFKQSGLDTDRYQKSGALTVIDYTQYYLIDGCFDIATTAKLCREYYTKTLSKGFKGLRIAAEMSCFFKHNLMMDLVDYESSLHKSEQIPIIAVFGYRASQLMSANKPINVYSELVKAHGAVMFSWIDKKLGRVAIS